MNKPNNSYKFFQNSECEWFPCHSAHSLENFSCLMCFCPLYHFKDCGGNFTMLNNGIKDCTNCTLPHYNYDYVINKLMNIDPKKEG